MYNTSFHSEKDHLFHIEVTQLLVIIYRFIFFTNSIFFSGGKGKLYKNNKGFEIDHLIR